MKKKKLIFQLFTFLFALLVIYFAIIPAILSCDSLVNFVCKKISQKTDYTIVIEDPIFRTYPNFNVRFDAERISASYKNKEILKVDNLKTNFSVRMLIWRKLFVNKIVSENFLIDATPLLNTGNDKKSSSKSSMSWDLDLFDAMVDIRQGQFLYSANNNSNLSVVLKNLSIKDQNEDSKYIDFDLNTNIVNLKQQSVFTISDDKKFIIRNKTLFIENAKLKTRNSEILIKAELSRKNGLNLDLSSKNFELSDLVNLISTNLLINNGDEILSQFKDIKGDFDFGIELRKNSLQGDILLNKTSLKLIPLNNLPVVFKGGKIKITRKVFFSGSDCRILRGIMVETFLTIDHYMVMLKTTLIVLKLKL